MAPIAQPTAQASPLRAEKKRKIETNPSGIAIEAVGLLLCFTLVGAIIGIPLIIVGARMSRKWLCSNCGNQTTKEAKICSTCGAQFV